MSTCSHHVAVVVLLASLSACNSARISEENTRLRREHLELSQQVEKLKADLAGRDGQIAALQAQLQTPKPAVEGVKPQDLPVVSKLDFGAYSGALDKDGDGKVELVRVYLLTLDQRGRFLPAVGKAVLQVVQIDAASGVKELARREYDAKAFDAAYVSGLTGTHFTLEAEISPPLPNPKVDVTIKVTFTDAATGAMFTQQMGQK